MSLYCSGSLVVRLSLCVVSFLSMGCALVSYPLITDNAGDGPFVVNTNAKAHVPTSSQTATEVGGRWYQNVDFVDQSTNGSHRVTTYQVEYALGPDLNFIGDDYCDPWWTGCAAWTYEYVPPADCTFTDPGFRLNESCLLFPVFGICFSSRPGECGKGSLRMPRGLQPSDLAALLGMGVEGPGTVTFSLNAANTRIDLISPQGSVGSLRLAGNQEVTLDLRHGRSIFNLSSPNAATTVRKIANLSDNGFRSGIVQITYGNVTRRFPYAALRGDLYRDLLARHGM